MTHEYIGTKRVTAWPQERDGQPGYAVKYADGYISWSPAAAFEDAYRVAEGESQNLTFGDALHYLELGYRVSRSGWNGVGMWLQKQVPDAHSKMTLPYLYLNYPSGSRAYPEGARVPWLASQTDVLSADWRVIKEPV